MNCTSIIFDLDGTLLDTLDDLADAGNRVLAAAGLPVHPVEKYRYFVGEGMLKLIERILPAAMREPDQIKRFAEAFREDYGRNWQVKTALYPGIADMLTALQDKGIILNVLSNKPQDFTRLCVTKFMPDWPFQLVLGQREGVPRKPDPAGALDIAAEIGRQPAEIVYLGDTATDMKTARAAGMYAVGALWGFRTAQELSQNGAATLVSHPGQLPDLFKG